MNINWSDSLTVLNCVNDEMGGKVTCGTETGETVT